MNKSGMANDPKVSVIVPIYNSKEYLCRCIDSLVYQTMEELEIILVDNQSTDKSFEIMKEYERVFPNKVHAYRLDYHFEGPGAGRNLGLLKAHADYIGFADSDDYFEYDAFEKMYNKAMNDDCDLVYCSSFDVKGHDKKLTRRLPQGKREEILTIGSMVFWNKLIKRELFDINGEIPPNMVFEDMAYCSGLVSYAKRIGYIDEPLYYYVIRDNSGVNTLNHERVLKELDAIDISIKNCSPDCLDVWIQSVAMRLCNNIRDRWQFTDAYIEKIKELNKYFVGNQRVKDDKRNYPRLLRYLNLPDDTIPKIIISNCEKDHFTSDNYTFFYKGDYEYVNMKNASLLEILEYIYMNGGIFIDKELALHSPLNCLIYNEAFFSFFDVNTFSEKIFGGKKGNKTIGRIIDLAKLNVDKKLGEVIYDVLHKEMGIPMNNKTNIYDYDVAIYGLPVFILDDGAKFHIADSYCNNNKKNIGITNDCLKFYLKNIKR